MPLYYVNESDTPRECDDDGCEGGRICYVNDGYKLGDTDYTWRDCDRCNGTGRLGNPDAPRFEVVQHDCRESADPCEYQDPQLAEFECARGWYAYDGAGRMLVAQEPTEPLAIAAARRALGGAR